MKKILLAGTALLGVVAMAAPAHAELDLDLGGYFLGYGVFSDNDEAAATSLREFDLRRESEVYVSGESTLDNGLTVGFMTQMGLGGNNGAAAAAGSGVNADEVYAYFSGGWGRFQLGSEDGAAYLLQVDAPSADSNVDGLLTWIETATPRARFDTIAVTATTSPIFGLNSGTKLDYNHQSVATGDHAADRFTYLTPKFAGFQAGASLAPEDGQNVFGGGAADANTDNDVGDYENTWEAAVRWDGEFEGFGISAGAGYSQAQLENHDTLGGTIALANDNNVLLSDDLDTWNVGANVSFAGFTVGGAWLRGETQNQGAIEAGAVTAAANDTVVNLDVEQDTFVAGLAWDNGPYHVGGSWLLQDTQRDALGVVGTDGDAEAALNFEAERFTVGGGYTFGPGMSFRGSVAWGEFDSGTAATSNDFQQVAVGTNIAF